VDASGALRRSEKTKEQQMSDPTTSGPSEEELRAYLEQLRAAQPVEVVVQSFGVLATAAEVKLGRSDARVLIDGLAALLDATAQHLPSDIVTRMRQTVSQLQMAQVQAEREAATTSSAGASQAAPTDQQAAGTSGERPSGPQGQESPASRLWIPGRD
jgi:hypothetical protein